MLLSNEWYWLQTRIRGCSPQEARQNRFAQKIFNFRAHFCHNFSDFAVVDTLSRHFHSSKYELCSTFKSRRFSHTHCQRRQAQKEKQNFFEMECVFGWNFSLYSHFLGWKFSWSFSCLCRVLRRYRQWRPRVMSTANATTFDAALSFKTDFDSWIHGRMGRADERIFWTAPHYCVAENDVCRFGVTVSACEREWVRPWMALCINTKQYKNIIRSK